MGSIKTFEELTTPDERTLRFTPLGLSTAGALTPEYAAEFQQHAIAASDLQLDVPEDTRRSFERVRLLHSYGILFYEAFTLAEDLAWLVLEQAFRERFVTYFEGTIPMINVRTGEDATISVQSFDEVFHAVTRGGSYANSSWELRLRSSSQTMTFRGTFFHLLRWARSEGLLHGQRNKAIEEVYRRIRNRVAHPGYHLGMPPDSIRTIRDIAEIINRLWGHSTPGGHLYPAPLEREILAIAWAGGIHEVMRAYQLGTFQKAGDWECVIVRAVWDDGGIWDFNAQYERTNFPAELLWGPGSPEDALAWLNEASPDGDTTEYLDRLFALRIDENRASLAMRPALALSLPPERRKGRWFLIRADYPNDAFAHVRHIKDGVTCGDPNPKVQELQPGVFATSPPIAHCMVEELFDGPWNEMVGVLSDLYSIDEPDSFSSVKVPPRFTFDVAPDVDAD